MTNAPLLSRLAEAKEGSRQLSDEVLVACGWVHEPHGVLWGKDAHGKIVQQANVHLSDPTDNLQDAVDLVRLFHSYIDMTIEPDIEGCDRVCLAIIRVDADIRFSGTAVTPALALCVAILKAMETGE